MKSLLVFLLALSLQAQTIGAGARIGAGVFIPALGAAGTSIAFDAAVDGGIVNTGTSLTWPHTSTGSNLILFVGVFGDAIGTDPTCVKVTGATYNTVAMTQMPTVSPIGQASDRCAYLFYLVAPATGAHNVVVSASSSIVIGGVSATYTGAKQTAIPDASANNTSAVAANITTSVTVVATNSWTLLYEKNGGGAATAGTGSTLRVSSANGGGFFDSGGPLGAGSTSQQVAFSGGANWATIMISFAHF